MGGPGAASGVNNSGRAYGTEYETLLQIDNVKYVKFNDADNAKVVVETMTKDRVYATINNEDSVKYITTYDDKGKMNKQIDVTGPPHDGFETPHVHDGYLNHSKARKPKQMKKL